jgi:hypothetical protein
MERTAYSRRAADTASSPIISAQPVRQQRSLRYTRKHGGNQTRLFTPEKRDMLHPAIAALLA